MYQPTKPGLVGCCRLAAQLEAPGPDGIAAFWWKVFDGETERLVEAVWKAIDGDGDLPSWLVNDIQHLPLSSSDSEDHPTNRPCRRRTTPSRYRRDSDDDSDQNDGTICSLCQSNEPGTMAASIVFWIDCNKCGCWVHNFCAFGNNTSSRRYLCPKCSHQ